MNLLFKDQKHRFLQRYELFQAVSYGTHGTVFRAIDYDTGDIVAVKMYRAVHKGQWRRNLLPYLRRELDALQYFGEMKTRHDNLIRMLDYDLLELNDDESIMWIILQNMERDLSMQIRELRETNESMSVEEIKRIAFHVVKGIQHLHSNGFIHKDVNTTNVLLGANEPTVKLADFSVALPTLAQGISAEQVGDLFCRPPEVMFRNATHGPAGDMWGLGLLICEMALGRKIIEGVSEIEVMQSMLGIVETSELNKVPQNLMDIVSQFRGFGRSKTVEDIPVKMQRIGDDGLSLVKELLSLDWRQRPTAQEVLKRSFFDSVRPQ